MQANAMYPHEGDLYKTLAVAGHQFELRYGYYEEYERDKCSPVVIFPDMTALQLYCQDGYPLVTQVQDACEYYVGVEGGEEGWCSDCIYYSGEHREIGVCRCEYNRIKPNEANSARRK